MRRHLAAILAVAILAPVAQAWAQTTPEPAPPGATPPPERIWVKCREDGVAKGLKGKALFDAENACAIAASPHAAAEVKCREAGYAKGLRAAPLAAEVRVCLDALRMEQLKARKCRQDGTAKGLTGGPLDEFVRSCRAAN